MLRSLLSHGLVRCRWGLSCDCAHLAMMLPLLACGTLQIKLSPLENDRVKLALASWKDHSARNPNDFELIAAWARDDIGLVRPAAACMPLA
jgi:hypothetical protein